MTTTEIATTNQTTDMVDAELLADFGGMEEAEVDTSDIIIPKILLGHSNSTAVKEEKVRVNTAYDSVSKACLIPAGDQVEVVLFGMFKTWVMKAKKGNKFIAEEKFTPENANRPLEGIYNDIECDFNKTLNYFAVLPHQIKNGTASLPFVLSFSRTGLKVARMIETERLRLKAFKDKNGKGTPLFFKTWNLGINIVSNDFGEWPAFDLALARNTTREELQVVQYWKKELGQVTFSVDASEQEGETGTASAPTAEESSTREF